ncbi:MAG: hypothetical protein Q8O10_06245 [candidate division Zixibacteria bacterium]|nr:hypothetical protein [candidate division Zixibacteria bacterium]
MTSDCEKLKESSIYIRNWIERQPAVKEESITDWLLYDVSEKIRGITYRMFTRHQEARETGADWEWWFLFPDFSAKMRVQAKNIDPSKDNYPSIAHTNKYGLQIEKLLQDSKDKNFIPLYAFYTCLQEVVMCRRGINDEGVYLSGGNRVYADFIQNGKTMVLAKDILARSVPLSCFLCCPLCFEGDRGFIRFLSSYYHQEIGLLPEQATSIDAEEEIPGIYRQVPGYVSSFIEHAREKLPDWWEKEFREYLEGVNALFVYDMRKKN